MHLQGTWIAWLYFCFLNICSYIILVLFKIFHCIWYDVVSFSYIYKIFFVLRLIWLIAMFTNPVVSILIFFYCLKTNISVMDGIFEWFLWCLEQVITMSLLYFLVENLCLFVDFWTVLCSDTSFWKRKHCLFKEDEKSQTRGVTEECPCEENNRTV